MEVCDNTLIKKLHYAYAHARMRKRGMLVNIPIRVDGPVDAWTVKRLQFDYQSIRQMVLGSILAGFKDLSP